MDSVTPSKMTDLCSTVAHFDVSENIVISRNHGLSVYPFESSELENESSACLGRAQFARISFVNNLLSSGFLDARQYNFNGLVQTIANHHALMWIEIIVTNRLLMLMQCADYCSVYELN